MLILSCTRENPPDPDLADFTLARGRGELRLAILVETQQREEGCDSCNQEAAERRAMRDPGDRAG